MNDREVDREIARRVMRWEHDVGGWWWTGPHRDGGTMDDPLPMDHEWLPRFSTEIVAAFRVVNALRQLGLRPVLMPDWGKQWQAIIYRKDQYVCQSSWTEFLPTAICDAALKACSA